MRKLRIAVIDLVTKAPTRTLYARVMYANLASIMPQVIAVWCEEKGHDEASSHVAHGSHTGTRVYAKCRRCGMGYTRSLTSKESQSLTKTLNTPMTI